MYLSEGHFTDTECVFQMIGMQQWPACCRFLLMCLRLYGVTQSAVTWSTHKRPEQNSMPLYRYTHTHLCTIPLYYQANWTWHDHSVYVSQTHSPGLKRFCESLGHFYLTVCFPEEKAALYAIERQLELERSSVCVLLLKSSVSRQDTHKDTHKY